MIIIYSINKHLDIKMENTKKISTKIWRPIIESLDKKIESSCLRRDQYLSAVLKTEVQALDAEISAPNTPKASKFISENLDELDRKLVTLTLNETIAVQLDRVCKKHNVNRDSFFNRLFFILAAPSSLIDIIFGLDDDWQIEVWSEERHNGPFFHNIFYPLEQEINPLWGLRTALELKEHDESIYTSIFTRISDKNLYGLNTYLPDDEIPDTPENEAKLKRSLDELDAIFKTAKWRAK